jgi:RHS repeat-associated protein
VTVAMREGSTFSYFLTDNLGSVVGVTDSSGTLVSESRYLPFGETRSDVGTINQTDFGYTFQRNLTDTGLMDYNARFYDPTIGKFVQPDTLVSSVGSSQGLNRYTYTYNNPVNSTDPSGNMPKGECGYQGEDCSGSVVGSPTGASLSEVSQMEIQPVPMPSYSFQVTPAQNTSTQAPKTTRIVQSTSTPTEIPWPTPETTPVPPGPISEEEWNNSMNALNVSESVGDYFIEDVRKVHIPFPLNIAPDFGLQLLKDSTEKFTFGQRVSRATVATIEGSMISGAAEAYAAGMVTVTVESGPGSIVLGGSAYVISSTLGTNIADKFNDTWLFPTLGLNSN